VRNLDFPQQLRAGRAKCFTGFQQRARHRGNPQCGEAYGRGQGEDDGGNQPRHDAQAEEDECGNQVDESRDGLHQIQQRPQRGFQPGTVRGGNANGHANEHAGECGEDHHGQGLHGFAPVAHIDDEQQRRAHKNREPRRALQVPSQRANKGHHEQRMHPLQRAGKSQHQRTQHAGNQVKQPGRALRDLVHHAGDRLAQGNFVPREPLQRGVQASQHGLT
jgi:hypothetical protein